MLEALTGTLLLAISTTALWQAAVRLASPVENDGAARALAAVTAVAAAAVAEALVLGLVGLGTSATALTLASAVLWLGSRRLLPRPERAPLDELRDWWAGLSPPARIAAGVAAGVLAVWSAHVLLEPTLDLDSTLYHLPEAAAWVENGTPGSVELITASFPVGNYPVSNEVLLSWAGGLSHNVGLLLLWAPFSAALLAAAFGAGVRELGARPASAALGAAVVLSVPIVGDAATRIGTDLPAAAWLAVAAALAIRAARRPGCERLLAFAILALGLAAGTKTVTLPLGAILLGWALWRMRGRLPGAALLAGSTTAAIAIGGIWYLRNLVDHGSPLWPFVALPGSDPLPRAFSGPDSRFVDQSLDTIADRLGDYLDVLGPVPFLLGLALILPLLLRSRGAAFAAAALAVGVLAWINAPFTGDVGGFTASAFAISNVRYMLPVIVLAVAILSVIAAGEGALARIATLALVAGLAWGLIDLIAGRDAGPAAPALVAGAIGGAAIASSSLAPRVRIGGRAAAAIAAGLAIIAALGLAAYPERYLRRFPVERATGAAAGDPRPGYARLARWFDREPGFDEGDAPVSFSLSIFGPLAGGDLAHPLELLTGEVDCESVVSRASEGYVVLRTAPSIPSQLAACFEAGTELVRLPSGAGELLVFGPEGV